MAKQKAKEIVKLHNKSKREYVLKSGQKSLPGRALDVEKDIADFYIKQYPKDFILYDDLASPSTAKAKLKQIEKENKSLVSENEALKKELEELKAGSVSENEAGGDGENSEKGGE